MRNADLTGGRSGRELRPGDRWRPLAQHLVTRFSAITDDDESMIQTAIVAILEAENHLDSDRPDFPPMAVPLVISALRRHQRELIRRRPASVRALPALQLAIAAAESELSRLLRRSPTVAEVAAHLDVAQHQIVTGLEAGWSAGSRVISPRRETP